MRGPGVSAVVAGALLSLSTMAGSAQSPSPSASTGPAPSFALASRGEAADDRFRLTIETDASKVSTLDAIDIRTTWTHLGSEPLRICTGGGGPVIFVVEQIDGPFDPGGEADAGGQIMTIAPGTGTEVPFQKSGGYDLSDPMAPQYAAWFDDPELHLPAGMFRITAHAGYAVDDCAPGTTLDASVLIEVSQAPTASPSPSSPTALARPTLPPPGTPGRLDRFQPRGRPDASSGRFGVRIELWLSPGRARPGEWVEAHIRVTNTRDEAVWSPGGCSRLAHIDVDLDGVQAAGEPQVAEAGRLKAAILDRASEERSAFRILDHRFSQRAVTVTGLALLDCNVDGSELARLGPGETLDVDAAWHPADGLFEGTRLRRPLSPGTVRVIARYDHLGHGAQPDEDRDPRPVTASTTLRIVGIGPAYPSPGELVDAALRDPAFAAWVSASPGGADWENAYLTARPGPRYPDQPRYADPGDRAPDGVAEVWLARRVDGTTASGIGLVDRGPGRPWGSRSSAATMPAPMTGRATRGTHRPRRRRRSPLLRRRRRCARSGRGTRRTLGPQPDVHLPRLEQVPAEHRLMGMRYAPGGEAQRGHHAPHVTVVRGNPEEPRDDRAPHRSTRPAHR